MPRQRKRHRQVRSSRWVVLAGLAVSSIVALSVGAYAYWSTRHGDRASNAKTAAIVDQLSLTAPDPAFVTAATKSLQDAGYRVEYFPGEQVTVEFYRHLPERNYDLVILRAHSGLTTITNADTGEVTHTKSVSLFTSQPFDATQYQAERNAGRLGRSRYLEDGQEVLGVFGIEPDFVRYSMQGRFGKTLVILMGCNGVDAPEMARAFLSRGASSVVGWDNFVSAGFTDEVTAAVLDGILARGNTVRDAVTNAASQYGRDPQYGGGLQLVSDAG